MLPANILNMQLKLAISTCPNDTFMFEALINKRIDTKQYTFSTTLIDIDELNQMAEEGVQDISKISFNALSLFTDKYQLLRSGSAIGFGNGPLIISKRNIYIEELINAVIAIPGENTTANLLMEALFPNAKNKKVYLFSDIENAILDNEVDAGLIIHETRFTFQKRGLHQIVELGAEWEKQMHLPLPLGGIAIKRNIADEIKKDIQEMVKQSVLYAFQNPHKSAPFVKHYAKELDEETISKHINLYVNEYSTWINKSCEEGICKLLQIASEANKKTIINPLFV